MKKRLLEPDYEMLEWIKSIFPGKKKLWCLHCEQDFNFSDLRWDSKSGLWLCPTNNSCNGGVMDWFPPYSKFAIGQKEWCKERCK